MISLTAIENAAAFLRGWVIHTPLVHSPTFSHLTGAEVFLKPENLRETGSFTLRGATYKIHQIRDQIGPQGVVAAVACGFISAGLKPNWKLAVLPMRRKSSGSCSGPGMKSSDRRTPFTR